MVPVPYITLRELLHRVRQTLEERFAPPVWVCAEIAEIKVNYSGHCYLELVEKGDGDGVPRAQARGVIWRSHYARIAAGFEAETGQRLAAGMHILAKATVEYHEVYGFSLQLLEIDPAYTLGDMERQRQQTIARLQCEGVWEMNRQQQLPGVVQRIAVVSSCRAAGYQDFCNELAKSPYRFSLTLFDAVVQGVAAEPSLVAALDRIASCESSFDAVAILRGGGSTSDLNCFNAYRLCNHVAQFPLPVLTGIGHDKDTSVADMVAHRAFKTPTAVAAWLVERMAQTDGWLTRAALQLGQSALGILHAAAVELERSGAALAQSSASLLSDRRARLEWAERTLQAAPEELLRRHDRRLTAASDLLFSYSVERVLQRGFAVVRRDGGVLRSVAGVMPGDRLDIELSDGRMEVRVTGCGPLSGEARRGRAGEPARQGARETFSMTGTVPHGKNPEEEREEP